MSQTARSPVSISDVEYEIESAIEAAASIRYPHQQFAPK
jgi:hypothetical protein